MPIYEYRCKDCDAVTEAFLQSRQEAVHVRCGQCGSGHLERIYLSPIAPVRTRAHQENVSCCGEKGGCTSPKRCCQH